MTECAKLGLSQISFSSFTSGDGTGRSVEGWLRMLDRGSYPVTYGKMAEVAKSAATEPQWTSAMEIFRKPLGVAVRRRCLGVRDENSPTEGLFRVVQFETEFEKKKEAVETVTLKKDPDGVWRPACYFIR